jgi:hypothetical protein
MLSVVKYAIPGEPAGLAGAPPAGEIERAVQALRALSEAIDRRPALITMPGVAIAPEATHDPGGERIVRARVRVDLLTWRCISPVWVHWRWRIIAERDDWWAAGWHPCHRIMAVTPEARARVDRALNAPHKLHWPPARATPRRRPA